jgi:glycosyltransferase involved in cell wall biosynthesis
MPRKDVRISVVMATYNGAKFLEEQIESILAQSITPSEFIVCDDHSTDGTSEILQKFAQKGCLQYFINPERIGLVGNFKRAVSYTAKENYIALSDQDDLWLPDKLEKSIELLEKIQKTDKPSMVYTDLLLVDENNSLLNPSFFSVLGSHKYQHCLETLLFGNFVLGCTVLMNSSMRSFFEDIPESKYYNHDAWITMIGFSFGQIGCINSPTVRYRKHQQNVTISNIKKTNLLTRLINHAKNLLSENNFLEEQFELVGDFFKTYQNQLSASDLSLMNRFLILKNGSYFKKKLAFEKHFKKHWIKRFEI